MGSSVSRGCLCQKHGTMDLVESMGLQLCDYIACLTFNKKGHRNPVIKANLIPDTTSMHASKAELLRERKSSSIRRERS